MEEGIVSVVRPVFPGVNRHMILPLTVLVYSY